MVIAAQAFLLIFLYNSKFNNDSDMLVGLTESRKSREKPSEEQAEVVSRVHCKSNIEKYVDSVNAEVSRVREDANFQKLSLDKKRIKLLEYFTLHIVDTDYTLLGENEQKEIMREFLRRYMPEK